MKIQIIIALVLIFSLLLVGCLDNNTDYSQGGSMTSYKDLLPERLSNLGEDFYPNDLTRGEILAQLPMAVKKTGNIGTDTWSGVIHVTGDLEVDTLTIEPGTIILIDANNDDQQKGEESSEDPVNPHEFLGTNYSKNHIIINVKNELNAVGTKINPIIFTSTADGPWLADWDHFVFQKGVLKYAIVEYCWGISIGSSDVTISHCLIRNMLQQGVMFGSWPEAGINGEPVSPNITYNFMYNFGHMGVQSFFSEPYIAHNVFIHKFTNNPELYECLNLGENGGLDIHGGNGTVEYNFLSYGYNADLEIEIQLGGSGIVICEAMAPEIRFNTIVGNKWGIELQGGMPVVNNNNIYNNADGNLVVRAIYAEPGREDKTMTYEGTLDFKNNYWGTTEKNRAVEKISLDGDIEINLEPISTNLISNIGPDWNEFEWLYK